MKRTFLSMCLFTLAISSLPGCKLLLETTPEKQPIQAPPLKVNQKVNPVQPEEITPANAQSKARQLLEEIESEGNN